MQVFLPKLSPQGYRIVVFRIFQKAKENIPQGEVFLKTIQMLMDVNLKEDKIRGLIILYDFENFDIIYVPMFLAQIKKFIHLATVLLSRTQ